MAEQACAFAEQSNDPMSWMYLDTLALAQSETGEVALAIETQRRAVALMPDDQNDPEMVLRLAALHLKTEDVAGADATMADFMERYANDAQTLNGLAWQILTEWDQYPDRYARMMSERACVLTEAANDQVRSMYLDTLALAQFRTGDVALAVETQQVAVDLLPQDQLDPEMVQRLAEFKSALEDGGG